MDDDELTSPQIMNSLVASRESVTRAAFYLADARISLLESLQRLRESQLRIDLSDELVKRMLISQHDDSWE